MGEDRITSQSIELEEEKIKEMLKQKYESYQVAVNRIYIVHNGLTEADQYIIDSLLEQVIEIIAEMPSVKSVNKYNQTY